MSRIIIGVPGPWADDSEVTDAIAAASQLPAFLVAGGKMIDVRSRAVVEVEVCPHDPRMVSAFEAAGGGALPAAELKSIARHRSNVYLIGDDCSLAGARVMISAAMHLLDAGGVGAKVESAGVAHPLDRWRYYARSGSTLSLYRAFVTMVDGAASDHHSSCGMHNFGLPDVSVVPSLPIREAVEVMATFNHWNLIERPALKDGTWFSCGDGEPAFAARLHEFGYEEDSTLNNPFGRWHLEPTRAPGPTYGPSSKEPLFMAMSSNAPEVAEATRRARATVGYFEAHFDSPYEYGSHMVKLRVTDGEDSAFFWTQLEAIEHGRFRARLFEVPAEFKSYQAGQVVECPRDELQDWAIVKSGTLVGGFSLRLQRSHVPEAERHASDLYTGMLSYAPLDEIPGALG